MTFPSISYFTFFYIIPYSESNISFSEKKNYSKLQKPVGKKNIDKYLHLAFCQTKQISYLLAN